MPDEKSMLTASRLDYRIHKNDDDELHFATTIAPRPNSFRVSSSSECSP